VVLQAGSPFNIMYRAAVGVHSHPRFDSAPWVRGTVRNDDGTPSALVHMWDRFPARYWQNFTVLEEESVRSNSIHEQLHSKARRSSSL
jgi:hypothetical protein